MILWCKHVLLIQWRPARTRPVIRRIGCNAVDVSAARGEYVEIMVNNVTVILVVLDTCKINTTVHQLTLYHVRYRVMSEVINNSASLFWLRHCCHLRSGKQHHTSVCHKRMFAWLTINTMLCVPYRTDSATVTVRYSNANKGIVHI